MRSSVTSAGRSASAEKQGALSSAPLFNEGQFRLGNGSCHHPGPMIAKQILRLAVDGPAHGDHHRTAAVH